MPHNTFFSFPWLGVKQLQERSGTTFGEIALDGHIQANPGILLSTGGNVTQSQFLLIQGLRSKVQNLPRFYM